MELFFIEIFRMGPGMGRLFMGPRFFIPLIFFAAIIAVILISRNKINNPFNNSGNKELDIYNEKHESAVDIIKNHKNLFLQFI